MGQQQAASAFGVVHKAATDRDDPAAKAVRAPGAHRAGEKFDAAAVRGKLAPLKAGALKAVVKR
jgi:hypothetical protein